MTCLGTCSRSGRYVSGWVLWTVQSWPLLHLWICLFSTYHRNLTFNLDLLNLQSISLSFANLKQLFWLGFLYYEFLLYFLIIPLSLLEPGFSYLYHIILGDHLIYLFFGYICDIDLSVLWPSVNYLSPPHLSTPSDFFFFLCYYSDSATETTLHGQLSCQWLIVSIAI